jgi:hypothetical protein
MIPRIVVPVASRAEDGVMLGLLENLGGGAPEKGTRVTVSRTAERCYFNARIRAHGRR